MKAFKIEFDFNMELFDTLRTENEKDYLFLKELNDCGFVVTTFEEYYNLLVKIDDITDGEYYIYNYGTYIASY